MKWRSQTIKRPFEHLYKANHFWKKQRTSSTMKEIESIYDTHVFSKGEHRSKNNTGWDLLLKTLHYLLKRYTKNTIQPKCNLQTQRSCARNVQLRIKFKRKRIWTTMQNITLDRLKKWNTKKKQDESMEQF